MQDRPTQSPAHLKDQGRDLAPQSATFVGDEAQHLNYSEILRFLRKYASTIAAVTALATTLSLLYSLAATPIYTAHAQILIESRLPLALRDQLGEASLALDSPQIESQIAILRSQQIARAVVDRLKLQEDTEFAPSSQRGLLGVLRGRSPPASDPAVKIAKDSATIEAFQNNLEVRRYGLSYVLDVMFNSRDADKSARIANAVADAFLADQLNVKVGAARQASDWREEQVNRLREQMNRAARAVQEFKARRDYRIGGAKEPAREPVRERASEAGDSIAPQVASPLVLEKRELGNTLEELEVTAQAYRKIYETNLQAHVDAVQRQALQFNDARVITAATTPLAASFPRSKLLVLFGLTMGALLGLASALVMQAFDRSVATPAQIEDGVGVQCLGVVPPIALPTTGVMYGVMRKASTALGLNIGHHPSLHRPSLRQALDAPGSRYGQKLRTLRAAINRIRKSDQLRVVGIGALEASQGATVLAANLGGLFASSGVRTVVIDLDGRDGGLGELATGEAKPGVAEILLGAATFELCILHGRQGGADLLPAGLAVNRAALATMVQADALTGLFSAAGREYELVLAVLPALDGAGDTMLYASHMEGVAVLAESGVTQAPRLAAIVNGLRSAGTRVIGAVLSSDEDAPE